jgi:hypothetical protein
MAIELESRKIGQFGLKNNLLEGASDEDLSPLFGFPPGRSFVLSLLWQ